jgi:hypothetical protein
LTARRTQRAGSAGDHLRQEFQLAFDDKVVLADISALISGHTKIILGAGGRAVHDFEDHHGPVRADGVIWVNGERVDQLTRRR